MGMHYKLLTPSTWSDFETVLGCKQGANGGCWCTWWRLSRSEWEHLGKSGRKNYFQQLVKTECHTGVIAFKDNVPYGWCAIAPSHDYPVIARSTVIKPSLLQGDWFISCFFVNAKYRHEGAMSTLLDYAIDLAKINGASAIEACPRDEVASSGAADLFVGKTSVFLSRKFKQIRLHRNGRPLLRLELI